MVSTRITISDLSGVTGYSRHQIHGLLRHLPGYGRRRVARQRVAREYTRHDVVILAVCCELEAVYRVRRDAIAQLLPELKRALAGPRALATEARLIIRFDPASVQYIDGQGEVQAGLVMPLQDLLRRIDGRLIIDGSGTRRVLPLGPIGVPAQRTPRSVQR